MIEPGSYTAPCIGGPMDGLKLPFDVEIDGLFNPIEYVIHNYDEQGEVIRVGRYDFSRTQHSTPSHRPHGDQWNWHPYIGGM